MRKWLRVFALLSLLFVIAAACSKPKESALQSGGKSKGASALAGGEADEKPANVGGKKVPTVSESGPAAKGYAAINPLADVAQARRVGELIKLQSTSYENPNTWLGVTKDAIKLNFAIDAANCGVNLFQLLANADATFAASTRYNRKAPSDQETINKEQREAIDLLVKYWNDHVQDVSDDIPQATEVMKKYNKPGHLFYGRKLTYDLVDAGSFQCPDKQTSAALTMRDRTKPFSSVVYDVPGLYQNGVGLASAMKAKIPADKRPMLFGLLDTSDKYLSSFAPYAWGEFQSATKQAKLGSGWICSDLVANSIKGNKAAWGNGKAVNATDPAYRGRPRKFGLVYANNANSNQVAAEFKTMMKDKCGITFDRNTTEFQINDNPARAADEGNQIAVRFKVNDVTSVIWLIDFLGAFFHIIDFRGQEYRPEIVGIGTGWDTSTVQRLSPFQDMVDKASMFYTQFGVEGFGFGPGDPFWVWHAYHKTSPTTKKACDPRTDEGMNHDEAYCKAPTAMTAWYYSWLPLIGGLIFAGPNLTPGTVSAGLQAYPETRYGGDGPTTNPVAVLVGAGPGQYYFITDGSSGRWRPGFVSPPPERVLGFPDFPDCQRHYTDWPDGLAAFWEKGGPNYNAWCGAAKYTQGWKDPGTGAAVPYAPSEQSGQVCTDTPSGKCETDNYPRWNPVAYR
jgi:hypothetical protein